RRAAAPAEGIGVADRLRAIHQAPFREILDDLRVSLLYEQPGEGRHLRKESTLQVDDMPDWDAFAQGKLEVIDAIRSRGVYDAGAVLGRHKVGIDDEESWFVGEQILVKRLISLAQEAL